MLNTSDKNTTVIAVTGFGPFSGVTRNSSSVAVDELKTLWDKHADLCQSPLKLITISQIPVTYEAVGKVVDEIWDLCPVGFFFLMNQLYVS